MMIYSKITEKGKLRLNDNIKYKETCNQKRGLTKVKEGRKRLRKGFLLMDRVLL